MLTVIIFLIVLAVLIFVHELGHFLFAKTFGIRVDAFKIGFGPKIFAWTPKKSDGTKGETEYGLNLIPFGGYVKIFGENPDDASTHGSEAEKRSMVRKPRWQQAVVLVGGVLFNFLFAAILYIGLFSHGVTATADGFPAYTRYFTDQRIMVTDVDPGSPAAKAGIKIGDVLAGSNISDIQSTIFGSDGRTISLAYIRGGQALDASITPITGLVNGKFAIGIAMDEVAQMKLPFFLSICEGGHYAIDIFGQTVAGLYDFVIEIFHGTADFDQITGPVGIAGVVGGAARLGMTYLLMVTALISINLAVINLIPFPALDGGRILFVAIESAIRRRIPAAFANWANAIGFGLLMVLMVIVTYRDIVKLFVK
jgi:regulator of sigma E protease